MNQDDVVIRCRGLVKRYGDVTAVDGLDLEVLRGECFGLLGPNGAGKTTTTEILEGLLPADDGDVTVQGLRWGESDAELRQQLGIQLQETLLPAKLTVTEVLRLFRSFYHNGHAVQEILDTVELNEKKDAWVSKLSGGQKQRLAIGCALVSEPDILFLDEPTTGLDPQARRKVWEIVEKFKSGGKTVLLTTHYMEEAERLSDRVAIVDHGKVIALGSPRDLIGRLGGEDVVEFSVEKGVRLPDAGDLESLTGVQSVLIQDEMVRLSVAKVHLAVPALLEKLAETGAQLSMLTTHHATLEDVFVALTGRHLREA